MMNYDNDTFTVSLTIDENNDVTSKQFTVSFDAPWTDVMQKLAQCVSAHYGYDITQNLIFLVNNKFNADNDLCMLKSEFEELTKKKSKK